MINVLIIANELRYICGVTNHILHLSKGLAESGEVKLFIICGGGNGTNLFKDVNALLTIDKRFFHKGRNITNYFSAITFLAKFIRKNKIDIIHSHSHYAANIAANAVKLSKSKTVQTNHGILKSRGRLKHFNADKYIAINEHISDYLINTGAADKDNIEFIRCGIPVETSPAEKTSEKIKVIAASRFTYEKGLDVYIKAVSLLDDSAKSKAEFLLAGDGELESSLKELSNKLNSGINFTGSITNIYQLLKDTHILVYPSRSLTEGFPAIITEAAACNNVVISSKFYGSGYILKNNENALMFEHEDINSLVSLLEDVINNYNKFSGISFSLYSTIKDKFRIDTMIEKHLNLYKKMISGN